MKKIIPILIIAVLGGFFYYFNKEKNNMTGQNQLTLYGNVDIREVGLGFRVPGRLEHMHLEEGDRVAKGDLLAKLDQETYRNELSLRSAQIKEIEAALNNAEKNYKRLAALVYKKSVSVSEYDDALALRDELKARLETAKVQLTLAETSFNDTQVFSPNSGTIITRVYEPGSILAAGSPVYILSLDEPVWVRTYIDEPDLGRVYPGLEVKVLTDSDGVYQGRVGFISPKAEFTPKNVETAKLRTDLVYRLRVVIENPDEGLRQGMPVTVKF